MDAIIYTTNTGSAERYAKLLAQERKETETKKTALQEKSLKKQDEVVRALIHLVVE